LNHVPDRAEEEALVTLALDAAGTSDGELLFLVGSMADGLANRNSDYDLYLIGTATVEGSETAARKAERTATIGYHRGREVNLAVLNPAALETLRDAFRAAIDSLSGVTGIAQVVDEDELKLLHRIRTGRALRRPDLLEALREEHRTAYLARYMFNVAAIAAVNRLADIAGELAEGHRDSAAWMYREMLTHTGQCALAASGVTVPATKWLIRLLQRQQGDCAAHVARNLLNPPIDVAAAVRRTSTELAALIDEAGDMAGPYVRGTARPKLA
jgi:hypothetical protein